jgi:hypothetical protein
MSKSRERVNQNYFKPVADPLFGWTREKILEYTEEKFGALKDLDDYERRGYRPRREIYFEDYLRENDPTTKPYRFHNPNNIHD